MAQDARIADEKRNGGSRAVASPMARRPQFFEQFLPENLKLGYRGLRIKTRVNSARQSMVASQARPLAHIGASAASVGKKLLGFAVTH
jgi:hypothetical protein